MRILYCYRYGILGGVCTQLINRLKVMMSQPGVEAHLLFARDYGIGQTLADYPFLYFQEDPAKARDLARALSCDAAVVIDSPEFLDALTGLVDVALITEVHTTTQRGLRYLTAAQRETTGYIVPSEYSRQILRNRFRIGEQLPVHVVSNSLDATAFPWITPPQSSPRPIIGWIGKLDDHKNWKGLLEFASELMQTGFDSDFWLIGGETAPQSVEQELLQEVYGRGLVSRFRWFPRIEYAAMCRAFGVIRKSGGFTLVTSIDESFGMSVLESLVCGCPVLASCVGALPELASGKTYLQFYELDRYDQAVRIAMSLLDPVRREGIQQEIHSDRDWLLNRYSTRNVTPRYLEALRALSQIRR